MWLQALRPQPTSGEFKYRHLQDVPVHKTPPPNPEGSQITHLLLLMFSGAQLELEQSTVTNAHSQGSLPFKLFWRGSSL
eukprot:1143048-Pelagomonas_calceolata.AAC.1